MDTMIVPDKKRYEEGFREVHFMPRSFRQCGGKGEMLKQISLISCMILLVTLALPAAQAGSLVLTLDTKNEYNLGEPIYISGNLTENGVPVADALVAIQVDDPHNNHFIVRTVPTGGTPTGPWAVSILQFITCDSTGNPKSNFTRGGGVGLKVTVRNNAINQQHVSIPVTLCYSNMVPFLVYMLFDEDMSPQSSETTYVYPIGTVPVDAVLGGAFAYASTLSGWPKNNGYALSPENSTSFNILSGGGGGGASYASEEFRTLSSPGEFNMTFRTNGYGGFTGNYTVTATSLYQYFYVSAQKTFNVYLVGDVNGDGKVRVDDVLLVAQHFGLNEGDPGWNPQCDLTGDGKVRVDDILLVAQAFGKYGSP
jgi:hypothetical protein